MKKHLTILYPFLLAVYPVLFLFSHNIGETAYREMWVPLFLVLAGAIVLFFLLKLFIKDKLKISLILSLLLIFFFSYGYAHEIIKKWEFFSLLARHRYLLILWAGSFGLISYGLTRLKNLSNVVKFFSIFVSALVLMTLINIASYEIKKPVIDKNKLFTEKDAVMLSGNLKNKNDLPDIYYLMPDGMANVNAFREAFGFDGSNFVKELNKKGFQVATNSRSNYPTTGRSLSSALNMDYVNTLSARVGVDVDNQGDIQKKMINDNKAMRLLKSQGYQFITFSSGWSLTNYNENADIQFNGGYFDEFPRVFAQTTLLKPFFSGGRSFFAIDADKEMRKRVLYAFDKLSNEVPKIEGPKFVFAHIPEPHPPFLFDANGNEVIKESGDFGDSIDASTIKTFDHLGYAAAYWDQWLFISKKLDQTVKDIIANSKNPPIIIIQSDHGAYIPEPNNPQKPDNYPDERASDKSLRAAVKNFSAYYLPGKSKGILPVNMSPVNTFRLVFDQYFGTTYGLLENKSHYHHPNQSRMEIPASRVK